MLQQRAAGERDDHDGRHLESMTSKNRLCQLILIYLKNDPAKFHPYPIETTKSCIFF